MLHPSPCTVRLSLVVVMSLLAVYFLFLDAHMVGALQIIVYAGAMMVLFLFVIMLLNFRPILRETQQSKLRRLPGLSVRCLCGAVFLLGREGEGASNSRQAR